MRLSYGQSPSRSGLFFIAHGKRIMMSQIREQRDDSRDGSNPTATVAGWPKL
jgi:hypothetical protein